MKKSIKSQIKQCFINEMGYWRVNVLATLLAIPYILFFALYCWSPFTMYGDIRDARQELIEVIGIDDQMQERKEGEIEESVVHLAEMSDLGKELAENDTSLVGRKTNIQIIRFTTAFVVIIGLIILGNVVGAILNFIKGPKVISKPLSEKEKAEPEGDKIEVEKAEPKKQPAIIRTVKALMHPYDETFEFDSEEEEIEEEVIEDDEDDESEKTEVGKIPEVEVVAAEDWEEVLEEALKQ